MAFLPCFQHYLVPGAMSHWRHTLFQRLESLTRNCNANVADNSSATQLVITIAMASPSSFLLISFQTSSPIWVVGHMEYMTGAWFLHVHMCIAKRNNENSEGHTIYTFRWVSLEAVLPGLFTIDWSDNTCKLWRRQRRSCVGDLSGQPRNKAYSRFSYFEGTSRWKWRNWIEHWYFAIFVCIGKGLLWRNDSERLSDDDWLKGDIFGEIWWQLGQREMIANRRAHIHVVTKWSRLMAMIRRVVTKCKGFFFTDFPYCFHFPECVEISSCSNLQNHHHNKQ